jgi:hypothetical protein
VCWRKKKQFFFEKRTKKLFSVRLRCRRGYHQMTKVFWFFFSKKEPLSCLTGRKPLALRSASNIIVAAAADSLGA